MFVGNAGKETARLSTAYGLTDIVQLIGYVPHAQSLKRLLSADLLLLILGKGAHSDLILPAKIFEYLAAGKPILALVPPGAAADLIREAQAGVVVDPQDVQAIADQIAKLYRKWLRGELKCTSDPKVVARYDRRRLTARLAEVLNEVIRRSADGD